MSNSLPLNPFLSVRPRGVDAPSKAPRKINKSKAPVGVPMARDRNGRLTVSLEPRNSGITIENREQRLSSEAKQARIARGGR